MRIDGGLDELTEDDQDGAATLLESAHGVHITTDALAELFAVSPQAIRKMTAGGMPKVDRNRYDLAAVLGWWIDRRDRRATEQAESAREELYREQTERERLENAKRRGEMIELTTHEAIVTELFATVADRLAAAPTRVTRDPGKRTALEELMADARTYVADQIGRLGDRRSARAATVDAASAKKSRPVGRPKQIATR